MPSETKPWPFIETANEVNAVFAQFLPLVPLERLGLGWDAYKAVLTGRPATIRRDWLPLHVYGYLARVRASRRLARGTYRYRTRIWLLRRLRPVLKTITAFRTKNPVALHALGCEVVLLRKSLEILEAARLVIDVKKF